LKRCEEALVAIEEVGHDKAEAALQLEAQVLFRLSRFDECIERYETLLAEHKGARSNDVVANVAAAYVASGRSAELPAAMRALHASPEHAPKAFEISYNFACGLIQMGDLAAAEEMLLVAQRECRA
jgi:tetratricopeptide (TPR) repeat protein